MIAGLVGVLAAGATVLLFRAALDADQRRHMDSFGRAIAAQLATLSAEPMIGGDRISLSVLATRMSEPPEVAAVSIYTVDDRALAINGTAPARAPHFTHPIVFEDTVAGYARVTLSPGAFRTGPRGAVLILWLLACGVASGLAGYLAARPWKLPQMPRPRALLPGAGHRVLEADPPEARPGYVLVINWFNQVSFAPADRARIIDLCLSRAEQVGSFYGAKGTELPGTGLLLAFNGAAQQSLRGERCFQVLCAALLIVEVLNAVNERQFMEGRPDLQFRFGLHEDPTGSPLDELPETEYATDTILLSAVAGNDTIAVSREVFDQLDQPERFASVAQEHAILGSLTTATAGRCAIVTELEDSYRTLLDQQAERLIDQPDSTSSPSTF